LPVENRTPQELALDFRSFPAERARIRAAMIELVAERGYERTSLEDVLDRAAVSRADFKRYFPDKEACCVRIHAEHIQEFKHAVLGTFEACEAEGKKWRETMRITAYVAARYFRDRPIETHFNVVRMLACGEGSKAQRDELLRDFVDIIDAGRRELDDPASVSRTVAENAVGAIHEVALKEIDKFGHAEQAERLVPGLMYMAVRPYLGHEAALEELTVPPPPEPERPRPGNYL
jgi:AcrR family transcriptional regulator